MRTLPSGLALIVVLGACDEVYTERRQVQLDADVQTDELRSGDEIVEDSRVCLEFAGYRASAAEPPEFEAATDEELRACYAQRLEGSAAFDAGCIALDTAGQVAWIIERRDCELEGPFGDDALRLTVVPFTRVRGAFDYAVPWPGEAFGASIDVQPPVFATGYFAIVGEPIYVVEGTLDDLVTRVVRDDAATRVAFTEASAHAVALRPGPSFVDDSDDPSPTLGFEARAGEDFRVTLALPAGELEVGDVHVVARTEIAAVTWAPLVVRVRDTDEFLQAGAMAVAYDADGHVLREPEATWEVVAGDFALETFDNDDNGVPDPDAWANLVDVCVNADAGEQREAILRGRLDGFEGTVAVQWECVEPHGGDGCGCESPGKSPSGMLALLMLLGFVRRRRATVVPRTLKPAR